MSRVKEFFVSENGKKTVLTVAVFLWMALIFMFSNQNKTVSGSLSSPIQDAVFNSTLGNKEYETVKQRNMVRVRIGKIVRSSAHFFLFAVLGGLSFAALMTYKMKLWQSAILASLWSWLYSFVDEIHQIFVPGRTFELSDICVDASGVLLGVGVAVCTAYIMMAKRKKENGKNV